jgi:hypothetical protein
MINEMLRWDPSKRPTAQNLLKFSFFDDYNPSNVILVKNVNQNASKRDFTKVSEDDSFNFS